MAIKLTIAALAALLFAQGAIAYGAAPVYAAPSYSQCGGMSVCVPEKVEKIGKTPGCAPGYTYDDKLGKCFMITGQSCPDDCNAMRSRGQLICRRCPKGYDLGADGVCAKPCKFGYTNIQIGGQQFCVAQCKSGWTAQGSYCLATDAAFGSYTPKACAAKKCILDWKLYFVSPAQAQGSASYASADNMMASAAAAYSQAGASCQCIKTKTRDIYPQDCQQPALVDPRNSYAVDDAVCLSGNKALFGKFCKGVCPVGCSEKFDKCQRACPVGMTECKGLFGDVYCSCTPSCDDKTFLKIKFKGAPTCPIAFPRPVPVVVVPAPQPKPVPAPVKPVVVVVAQAPKSG
jgi:hypothetical protein